MLQMGVRRMELADGFPVHAPLRSPLGLPLPWQPVSHCAPPAPTPLQLCRRLEYGRSECSGAWARALAEGISKTLLSTLLVLRGGTANLQGTGWWQSQTLSSCPGCLFLGLSSVQEGAGPGQGRQRGLSTCSVPLCVCPARTVCAGSAEDTLPPEMRRRVVVAGIEFRVLSGCDDCPHVVCSVRAGTSCACHGRFHVLPEVEGLAQPGAQCPLSQLAAFAKQGSCGRASQLLRVDALREWVSPRLCRQRSSCGQRQAGDMGYVCVEGSL